MVAFPSDASGRIRVEMVREGVPVGSFTLASEYGRPFPPNATIEIARERLDVVVRFLAILGDPDGCEYRPASHPSV